MKKARSAQLLLLLTVSTNVIDCSGQSSPFWGDLEPGPYEVGYRDTILYKQDEHFKFKNYDAAKPFFTMIWYPAKPAPGTPDMTLIDYWRFNGSEQCSELYSRWHKNFADVQDTFSLARIQNVVGFPSGLSSKVLFDSITATTVHAKYRIPAVEGRFPCVLFHHGAQGMPDENSVTCEFLASHGFVVVSSSFSWPLEDHGWHTSVTDTTFDAATDIGFMAEKAGAAVGVDAEHLFAIGHSWGAQELIAFDARKEKPFKSIIALHTTLEPFDLETARKYWGSLVTLMQDSAGAMTTPTCILAPTDLDLPDTLIGKVPSDLNSLQPYLSLPAYAPFRGNKTTPYSFITVRYPLGHDEFISLGLRTEPLLPGYITARGTDLSKEQESFEHVASLCLAIISSKVTGQPFDPKAHSGYFTFETVNP